MKHIAYGALCATVLAAATIATATADDTAPSRPSSVYDTIRSLQDKGYKVIVNKTGNEPLRKCRVGSIRPGHGSTRERPEAEYQKQTINLDVIC